jgi:hypothetical protein
LRRLRGPFRPLGIPPRLKKNDFAHGSAPEQRVSQPAPNKAITRAEG